MSGSAYQGNQCCRYPHWYCPAEGVGGFGETCGGCYPCSGSSSWILILIFILCGGTEEDGLLGHNGSSSISPLLLIVLLLLMGSNDFR